MESLKTLIYTRFIHSWYYLIHYNHNFLVKKAEICFYKSITLLKKIQKYPPSNTLISNSLHFAGYVTPLKYTDIKFITFCRLWDAVVHSDTHRSPLCCWERYAVCNQLVLQKCTQKWMAPQVGFYEIFKTFCWSIIHLIFGIFATTNRLCWFIKWLYRTLCQFRDLFSLKIKWSPAKNQYNVISNVYSFFYFRSKFCFTLYLHPRDLFLLCPSFKEKQQWIGILESITTKCAMTSSSEYFTVKTVVTLSGPDNKEVHVFLSSSSGH